MSSILSRQTVRGEDGGGADLGGGAAMIPDEAAFATVTVGRGERAPRLPTTLLLPTEDNAFLACWGACKPPREAMGVTSILTSSPQTSAHHWNHHTN